LPLIVVVVLFIALLVAYPWWVLSIGTLFYLVALPWSYLSHRDYQRRDAEAAKPPAPAVDVDQTMPPQPPLDPERPARLN
jgi:CDP-diacylglycerol---serine O-phosphatidyltransferase